MRAADPHAVRTFSTGATRSPDAARDDPEGFLSPLVIDRFNQYMTKHRVQSDGSLRDSDNWQKGMPLASYMKGGWRHFLHWWTRHRGWEVRDPGAAPSIEEDLCALLFNVQGYLHELLRAKVGSTPDSAFPAERRQEIKPIPCSHVASPAHAPCAPCIDAWLHQHGVGGPATTQSTTDK